MVPWIYNTSIIWSEIMRNFIVVGHRAVTSPHFSLNDLPGTGGRLDILARAVNAAFFLSHDIRREVEVALVLLGPEAPPRTIRFIGSELKYLNPDERSTGALIRNALTKYSSWKSQAKSAISKATSNNTAIESEIKSSYGIYISSLGFAEVLEHYRKNSELIYLHESGSDISKGGFDGDLTFVLSDDQNFTPEEEQMIKKLATQQVSIGPKILHTEHCVTILHNFLDRLDEG